MLKKEELEILKGLDWNRDRTFNIVKIFCTTFKGKEVILRRYSLTVDGLRVAIDDDLWLHVYKEHEKKEKRRERKLLDDLFKE